MNIYLKQTLYIISISLFFSIVRYFFIEEDFPIIKPISKASLETYSSDASVDSLRNYLNNINEPKIINIKLAKKIHENNLATFIDARDVESFSEQHIKNAINITYEVLEGLADMLDIDWLNETNEDYFINWHIDEDESYSLNNKEKVLFFGRHKSISFISNYVDDGGMVIEDYLEFYGPIQNNSTVFVIYCSGKECSLSEELAFYMYDRFKIKKILIYEGGMPEWIENGLPVK